MPFLGDKATRRKASDSSELEWSALFITLIVLPVWVGLHLGHFIYDLFIQRYRIRDYVGEGIIEDRGIDGPGARYYVYYPEVSLAMSGEYRYSAAGLPPVHLALSFESDTPLWDEGNDRFSEAQTVLSVTVCDDLGKKVAACGSAFGKWKRSSSLSPAEVWHTELTGFDADTKRSYEIRISVRSVEDEKLDVALRPCLSGGWWLDLNL